MQLLFKEAQSPTKIRAPAIAKPFQSRHSRPYPLRLGNYYAVWACRESTDLFLQYRQ
jgi:hypothetical protein